MDKAFEDWFRSEYGFFPDDEYIPDDAWRTAQLEREAFKAGWKAGAIDHIGNNQKRLEELLHYITMQLTEITEGNQHE